MNIRRFTVNELIIDIDQLKKQIDEVEKVNLDKLSDAEFENLESDLKHNFLAIRALERNKRFHNGSIDQSVLTDLLAKYRGLLNKMDENEADEPSSKVFTKIQFLNFERQMGTVGVTVLESCFNPERLHHLDNSHLDFPDTVFNHLKESTDLIIFLSVLNENHDKFDQLSYIQSDVLEQYLTKLSTGSTPKIMNMAKPSIEKLRDMKAKDLFCGDKMSTVSESVQEFETDFKGHIL